MPSTLLLCGGTVLQHDSSDAVTAVRADILVEENTITRVAADIAPPSSDTRILDCTHRIISPGFIDTHRHLWQTPLKGRHGDELFFPFMLTGGAVHGVFTPQHALLGELAGALESIDAGTTTVVDHAHLARSTAHLDALEAGLAASGIRAIFCPSLMPYVKQWEPKLAFDPEMLPSWFQPWWDSAAERLASTNGRIRLGLGFDAWSVPKDQIRALYQHVRGHRFPAQVITSHQGLYSDPVATSADLDLLGPDILIAHANEQSAASLAAMHTYRMHSSTTPSTELQMGFGRPSALDPNCFAHSSLGVDCHSVTSASLLNEARALLQWSRADHALAARAAGQPPPTVMPFTVEQAFNLATIHGARAIRLEHELGSIAPGKRADLVVWDARSPAMACAARQNPLAAIVLHSSTRDVDAVVVDGIVRKEHGELVPVMVNGTAKRWVDLVAELEGVREEVQEAMDSVRLTTRMVELMAAFSAL